MTKSAWTSILVSLLALGVVAQAQQTGKVARIGFLDSSTASGMAGLLEAFRQLGWIEGKNIVIEYWFADLKSERLPELATELLSQR